MFVQFRRRFVAVELKALKKEYPKAKVLVHPQSPADAAALGDAVGSTSGILKAAREMDCGSRPQ